jgi:SOS-response transcriptional repressor LexA
MTPAYIKAELELKGLSLSALALRLGVSPSQISQVVAGKRSSPHIRQAIAEAIARPVSEVFPDPGASPAGVALDRQLTAVAQEEEGGVAVAAPPAVTVREILPGKGRKITAGTIRPIPLIGKVPAGPLSEAIEEPIAMLQLPVRGSVEIKAYALQVEGDSMAPELIEGDLIIVSEREPKNGELAVVQFYDSWEATVKRVRWKRGSGEIVLEAINPRHPQPSVSRKEIARLHRVEAVLRVMK